MNKIENYLKKLKQKELIYLFLSIPIVVFIIYYQFLYPNITKQNSTLEKKEKSIYKKLGATSSKIRLLKSINPSMVKKYKLKLENLQSDYKYIKYNFATLEVVHLDDEKLYELLTHLLSYSKKQNLNASIKIDELKPLKPYDKTISISIYGNANYKSIIKFLNYIESRDVIKNVTDVNIDYAKNSETNLNDFTIKFQIVGVK
jgi:Tfp pilus assembly protein PilO